MGRTRHDGTGRTPRDRTESLLVPPGRATPLPAYTAHTTPPRPVSHNLDPGSAVRGYRNPTEEPDCWREERSEPP